MNYGVQMKAMSAIEIMSRRSMVGEIECPCRHHDALYDDVINAHPFEFTLANQKARFTNSTN